MSSEAGQKKYVTFRDLKQVARPQETTHISSASTPGTSSIAKAEPVQPETIKKQPPLKKIEASNPIAPEKDFQRIPNSVTRHAIPQGLFKGKSKQVWDYLWSISRGAIKPSRTVRKSRKEIKSGSGLGSMVTVDAAIAHLQAVGLIKVQSAVGSLIGNEYEIFSPEEALNSPSTSSTSSTSSPTQKVVYLDVLESSISSTTQLVENTGTYPAPNTFLNTIEKKRNDDDEPLGGLLRVLNETHEQLTGKEPTFADVMKWQELGELLAIELKIAAARTPNGVSNVPAFLVKHLSTRLFKKNSKEMKAESEVTPAEDKGSAKDVSTCRDCKGSGWYYPNGYEGGVVKCKHEKII